MLKRALYDVLRVEQTASEQEIKTAYRKLAAHYHPDVFWGDKEYAEEIMKEINHAYAILSDPESRRIYDAELRIQQEAEKQDEERQPPKPANTETKAAQNIDKNRTSKYRFRWRNAICYIIFFIIFALVSVLLLGVSVYLSPDNEVSRNIDTAFNPTSLTLPDISMPMPEIILETTTDPTDSLATKEKKFTLGSSKEEVKNIMGIPSEIHDYTSFTAWYYRDGYRLSTVTFDETGHVEEWINAGNLKLK